MSEEKYISIAEVRDLLTAEGEQRSEKGIEFTPVQKSALIHAQAIASLSADDTKEIVSQITQLEFFNSKSVPEYVAYRVADHLPKTPVDVRAVFAKERINLTNEDIDSILEIVAKYL